MQKIGLKTMCGLFALVAIAFFVNAANAQDARGKEYTKAEIGEVVKRVEERSNEFVESFNKSLDKSVLEDSRREDNVNERARQLEDAADKLRKEFEKRENWQAGKNEVENCLVYARAVNKTMRKRNLDKVTEEKWNDLRFELNTLAKIYGLIEIR